MKGKAHVYQRDHINTDEILPARYMNMYDEKEMAKHAMEDLDKEFLKKAKSGDFVIVGDDFGCGSSREHAIWALRGSGIKAVIANSFARIYYRNSINNGYLAIECRGINKKVSDGDEIEIDLKKGKIINLTKKEEYSFPALPEFVLNIMNQGGLLSAIKHEQ